ncbi:CoA transferase [Mesorhizobium sp. B2-7-3]|nr:CoA transferase [Mesorhizobium sp. B2-7-3]
MSERALPLEGVKVVEFCQVAAGPFCAMLLADFGADVVKVENVEGGDGMRQWPPLTSGFSENFASLNRNKRSIALNLKAPEQREIALQLCREANVVVENNRPGVMGRLGLGFDDIRHLNPSIIYASISGFGQIGPRSNEGGFDVTIQAISGIMSVTGEPDGGTVKCGVPVSDFATGLYAAFSIASALRQAEQEGFGRYIDVSLLGSSLGISALQTSEYFGTGVSPRKLGAAHPRNAPYQAFRAMDGSFVMAAGNDKLWVSVCDVVGLPELLADARFGTNSLRAANQTALSALLGDVFIARSVESWLDAFRASGVPCAPINDFAAALADPQVAAMGWVERITLPGGDTTDTFGCPVRLDGQSPHIRRGPPALGEHTSEIMEALQKAKKPERLAS